MPGNTEMDKERRVRESWRYFERLIEDLTYNDLLKRYAQWKGIDEFMVNRDTRKKLLSRYDTAVNSWIDTGAHTVKFDFQRMEKGWAEEDDEAKEKTPTFNQYISEPTGYIKPEHLDKLGAIESETWIDGAFVSVSFDNLTENDIKELHGFVVSLGRPFSFRVDTPLEDDEDDD